ncbi:putative DNA-directed DNA polymerase [Helianthus anomalus]
MAVRGSEVVSILARKGRCERASIDEVVLYKPPVISTFSIHDMGTKIKWVFKGFNFISHIFGTSLAVSIF